MPTRKPTEMQICFACKQEFVRGDVNNFIIGRCNLCTRKLFAKWRGEHPQENKAINMKDELEEILD
jgi:DNA-directed RNA polymerase subunit RPC12/RpoP